MGRETMRTLPKNRDAFNDEEHQQTARPHPGLRLVGRYWHFHLKINGQRSHGSTRCTDLATARKVLEHKRREIVKGQLANKPRVPTVRELVVEWLAINRMTFSKSHIKSSECAMRLWVIPVVGSLLLTQVTLKHGYHVELGGEMLCRDLEGESPAHAVMLSVFPWTQHSSSFGEGFSMWRKTRWTFAGAQRREGGGDEWVDWLCVSWSGRGWLLGLVGMSRWLNKSCNGPSSARWGGISIIQEMNAAFLVPISSETILEASGFKENQ